MSQSSYEKVLVDGIDDASSIDLEEASNSFFTVSQQTRKGRSLSLDPRVISDAILGLSDGMTVPFALTAGLSELGDTRVVVLAGLAELVAGAISMGLGGYLGAKSEREIYNHVMTNTQYEIKSLDMVARSRRVSSIFDRYNFHVPASLLRDLALAIAPADSLPEFLVQVEHGMSEPADSRALICALTIACGYFIGGFIPLLPYLLVTDRKDVHGALRASVMTMVVTLFLLGFGKACLISASSTSNHGPGKAYTYVMKGVKGGIQMLAIGGLSAGCAIILVKSFNSLL